MEEWAVTGNKQKMYKLEIYRRQTLIKSSPSSLETMDFMYTYLNFSSQLRCNHDVKIVLLSLASSGESMGQSMGHCSSAGLLPFLQSQWSSKPTVSLSPSQRVLDSCHTSFFSVLENLQSLIKKVPGVWYLWNSNLTFKGGAKELGLHLFHFLSLFFSFVYSRYFQQKCLHVLCIQQCLPESASSP